MLRITGGKEVREEPIPFEVRRIEDPDAVPGHGGRGAGGQAGLRRVTYSLRTVNGVKQKPRRIRSEVVREPRTQVVKVGTKPLPTSVQGADHLNWQGLAACESGGRPDAVDSSGTYGGLYQFDTQTWQNLGGKGRPQDAPGGGTDVPGEEAVRAAGGESLAALRGAAARVSVGYGRTIAPGGAPYPCPRDAAPPPTPSWAPPTSASSRQPSACAPPSSAARTS